MINKDKLRKSLLYEDDSYKTMNQVNLMDHRIVLFFMDALFMLGQGFSNFSLNVLLQPNLISIHPTHNKLIEYQIAKLD